MASFYHFRGNLAWLCRVTCMFVIIVSGKSRDDNIGSEGEEHASEPTAEPFTLSNGVLMNPKTAATESRVERLTLTKFDWKVSNGSDWFVKFYAPWCPHCRMMDPVLEEVAQSLSLTVNNHRYDPDSVPDVVVAKVDVETEIMVGIRFLVASYPTCVFITDGGRTVRYYHGPRSAQPIIAWVTGGYEQTRPWCGIGWWNALHPFNMANRFWRLFFEFHPLTLLFWLVEKIAGLESVGFAANSLFAISLFPLIIVVITLSLILCLEGCFCCRKHGQALGQNHDVDNGSDAKGQKNEERSEAPKSQEEHPADESKKGR